MPIPMGLLREAAMRTTTATHTMAIVIVMAMAILTVTLGTIIILDTPMAP